MVLALAGCERECIDKPFKVRCVDGWGDTVHGMYGHYTYKCEHRDGVTYTGYGSFTGDCHCEPVPKSRRCTEEDDSGQ